MGLTSSQCGDSCRQGAELDVKGPGGIITSAEEESLKTDRVDVTDNRADNF